MTTPTNREAADWETKFEIDWYQGVMDGGKYMGMNGLESDPSLEEVIKRIKSIIRQTHLDLLREVEQWMRIENSVSIVHQEEWEAFMKELKGRYESI